MKSASNRPKNLAKPAAPKRAASLSRRPATSLKTKKVPAKVSAKAPAKASAASRKAGTEQLTRLLDIMARLRDPARGCPWDLEQNLASLRPYMIEEAYEALDASESGNRADLREELGDLLLQIVFQAQVAAEEGSFDFADVARGISDKMIYRHPHIFGSAKAATSAEVLRNWDALKRQEKKERTSALDGIPKHVPPLHRAFQLQKRAARAGFDWPGLDGALAKMEEEIGELKEAIAQGGRAHIIEELGDSLFALVKVARFLNCDPHHALEGTNRKFERRFRVMEKEIIASGRKCKECTLAQMEEIWNRQRAEDKKKT